MSFPSPIALFGLRDLRVRGPVHAANRRRSQAGFSLVETVLALGIVVFASTVVVGTIPVGLNSFRNSIDETMQSQIVNSLTTQATQTDFQNLDNLTGSDHPHYFDDEGQPVARANLALYTAVVTDVTAPGLQPSSNLKNWDIKIYDTRGSSTLPAQPNGEYTIRVANTAQTIKP